MSCLVIAEAGVNHNGSEEMAVRLVETAAACGADAVKFQTFSAERLVKPGTETAAYQRENAGASDQFAMLKALELRESTLRRLKDRADSLNVEFMSTPFDIEAARLLVDLGMRRIKVPSGEITNLPLLAELAGFDLPLVVSTGMADLAEVREAVDTIETVRRQRGLAAPLPERVTLLHCTSNYPAEPSDVNLRAMLSLESAFGLPVGYSDHTKGTAIAVAAAALGAVVIEKHFTLDCTLPGPDHRASLAPDELRRMIEEIRAVEAALGDGVKAPRPTELPVRALVRRSITLCCARRRGERIEATDLVLLRPGTGIPPRDLGRVAGKRAARDLDAGAQLAWGDLVD